MFLKSQNMTFPYDFVFPNVATIPLCLIFYSLFVSLTFLSMPEDSCPL